MADSPVQEGQVLAGKYRVERVLGSGGMGVVVAAWHLELEQRVAVKFLHPLALERADTAERFRREARSVEAPVHRWSRGRSSREQVAESARPRMTE